MKLSRYLFSITSNNYLRPWRKRYFYMSIYWLKFFVVWVRSYLHIPLLWCFSRTCHLSWIWDSSTYHLDTYYIDLLFTYNIVIWIRKNSLSCNTCVNPYMFRVSMCSLCCVRVCSSELLLRSVMLTPYWGAIFMNIITSCTDVSPLLFECRNSRSRYIYIFFFMSKSSWSKFSICIHVDHV